MKSLIFAFSFFCIFPLLADYCWEDRYGNCNRICTCSTNSDVSLCTPDYDFGIEFKGLWLQPTACNTHFGIEASPKWKIYDVKTDYHFGFDLGVKASFCRRNSVASLNYIHFQSSDSSCKVGSSNIPFNKAKGEVEYHFDAVHLDYGICTCFGDYLEVYFMAGLGYTRLKQDYEVKYSNFDNLNWIKIQVPSSFVGMGPELGFNFSYCIWRGIQVVGGGKGILFIGNLKNQASFKHVTDTSVHVRKRTTVVPAFEGGLGIATEFTICGYTWTVDGGYQALIYLNALQSTNFGSEAHCSFKRCMSHFALAGPYLKLELDF